MADKLGQLNEPFLLAPAGKDYLWGGSRLNDDFSKGLDLEPLAETWECSTHPDGISRVSSGQEIGRNLVEVLRDHPEYMGDHPRKTLPVGAGPGQLPILVKLIDAKQDLSVQVHPDDDYAREHEDGSLGKSEMWYVVDAARDAHLIYGFRRTMDEKTIRHALETGEIEKYLQKIPIHTGDVFFIEAGTVHAICEGALVAEVQESSNLTYRLYDYHRVGKDGKERELHIDKALAVANLSGSAEPRQPMRTLKYKPGFASEFLCRCKYFEVEHLILNTERIREMASFQTDENSFQVLLCTDGCGVIFWDQPSENVERVSAKETVSRPGNFDHALRFFKGDTIFVPARSVRMHIHGNAQFLKVYC